MPEDRGYTRRVLRYVREHPGARRNHLCSALGVNYNTINTCLWRLRQAGLIEMPKQGDTWGRCYAKGHHPEQAHG